jgi:hypothetical protein
MKILIPCDDTKNAYIPSLVNAYQSKGCEVVVGVANFFQSNYCPDIVHIQWPESLYLFDDLSLYGDPLTIIPERIMHYKANRAVVIWTVHNINPHYSKNEKIDRLIYEKIIDMSDIIVHHGKISIELMKKNYEKIKTQKNIICPHGDYLIQYCPVDKEVAREKLEIPQDKTVLLIVPVT